MMTIHISDDRLVELYFAGTLSTREQGHLGECRDCDQRRIQLTGLLDDAARAATQEVNAAFPAARLAQQQSEILMRVEDVAGPARVIAFPTAPSLATSPAQRVFSTPRWVAVAAIVGLVVGVAAGRAGREPSRRTTQRPVMDNRALSGRPTLQPASAVISDDQFLVELETAREGLVGALRPLDRMTP